MKKMPDNNNIKVKGLLKGLRYISQIFENEKESEMEIGLPTDVKHVAHIGYDGESSETSAPGWMNEFKGPSESSSGPLDGGSKDGSSRRGARVPNSPSRDLPVLPKSKQHPPSAADGESNSPTKQKTSKTKQTRRSSKQSSSKELGDGEGSVKQRKAKNQVEGDPGAIAKKNRRKKSKEEGGRRDRRRGEGKILKRIKRLMLMNNKFEVEKGDGNGIC